MLVKPNLILLGFPREDVLRHLQASLPTLTLSQYGNFVVRAALDVSHPIFYVYSTPTTIIAVFKTIYVIVVTVTATVMVTVAVVIYLVVSTVVTCLVLITELHFYY